MEIENLDEVLNIIEVAKGTGKVRKGINEVTKAIERSQAKLVAVATDVSPPEIILHLKPLCEEKNIMFANVGTKEELGAAAGLAVGTVAVAVTDAGEAKKGLEGLGKAPAAAPKEEPQKETAQAGE